MVGCGEGVGAGGVFEACGGGDVEADLAVFKAG